MNAKANSQATAHVHSPPKNMMEYSTHLQSRRGIPWRYSIWILVSPT